MLALTLEGARVREVLKIHTASAGTAACALCCALRQYMWAGAVERPGCVYACLKTCVLARKRALRSCYANG